MSARPASARASYGAPYRASGAPLAPPVPPVVREHDGVLVVRDVAGAAIHIYPRGYGETAPARAPFPADPHYEDKAWEVCLRERGPGKVLFWNVTEPAS